MAPVGPSEKPYGTDNELPLDKWFA